MESGGSVGVAVELRREAALREGGNRVLDQLERGSHGVRRVHMLRFVSFFFNFAKEVFR